MDDSTLEIYELSELARFARHDVSSLGSADLDPVMQNLVRGPALPAALWELDRAGVQTVQAPALENLDPEQRLETILRSGANALNVNDVPVPDLGLYRDAQMYAQEENRPFEGVLADARLARSLQINDADLQPEAGSTISMDPLGDTGPQQVAQNGFSGTPSLGGKADTADQPALQLPDVDPVDYKTLEVRVEAYELQANPVTGTHYGHAYLVIDDPETENPYDLVFRGGPTAIYPGGVGAAITNRAYDGINNRGWNNEESYEIDVVRDRDRGKDGLLRNPPEVISTTDITSTLELEEARMEQFNAIIGEEDIPYRPRGPNSNTYVGDGHQVITGLDVVNDTDLTTPGINESYMDYDETPFHDGF